MIAKSISGVLLLLLCSAAIAQKIHRSPEVPRFMGREVIITEPETGADGYVSKGSASICIEEPPRRQCYDARDQYGYGQSELIEFERNMHALLFRADAVGASSASLQFALLRPGNQKDLDNLFTSDVTLSNQSEHAFWSDPVISAAKIFVTADFVWGPDESHYGSHRYAVSSYVLKKWLSGDPVYGLEDRYMTARGYDYEKAHILISEKPEIIARLRRLKAGAKPTQTVPRIAPKH